MRKTGLFKAWSSILAGRYPMLSIEITRECPLRCPGCYAYEEAHLGQAGPLRSLADFKGQELVKGVLGLVEEYRPVHLSVVGGEPLVRFRELQILLPRLSELGVSVQLVTSAVREIPEEWSRIRHLDLVVSIDGLQPEHDRRRAPATYERILKHIQGHSLTIHCTVTRQMAGVDGGFGKFLEFWSMRPEVKKIWFSFFTPQVGAADPEILTAAEKATALAEIAGLRSVFPKLYLPDRLIRAFNSPPASPRECIFARSTACFSADLETAISPCQLGGDPDCSQCGCMASVGLKALGDYRLLGILPLRAIYGASDRVGKARGKGRYAQGGEGRTVKAPT